MTESPVQHRSIAPGPSPHYEASGESPSEGRQSSPESFKKRVSMACLACKKSKRKCSGEPPCDNCRVYTRECLFDETLDQRRRVAAKRTAEELCNQRSLYDSLMKVLRFEELEYSFTLFADIRHGATNEAIRAKAEALMQLVEKNLATGKTGACSPEEVRRIVDAEVSGASLRPRVMDIHYMCNDVPYRVLASPWTNVTTDSDLVSHLVSVYFTWDYPVHSFLDCNVFLKHMARLDINSQFCSPFLVNALLANACQFCDFSDRSYVDAGDILNKADEFLAEAERCKDKESNKKSLSFLQGTLLLHQMYFLAGQNDRAYETLHQAVEIGIAMGLIGSDNSQFQHELEMTNLDPETQADITISSRRTAWGLCHIDTVSHTDFLRPPRVSDNNQKRPDKRYNKLSEESTLWTPYPTHREQRPSYLEEYFDHSFGLCEICRKISQTLLLKTDGNEKSVDEWNQIKYDLFGELSRWYTELPESFDVTQHPPPYIIMLRMRYHTSIVRLLSYKAEDMFFVAEPTGIASPEDSPSFSGFFSRHDAIEIIQREARSIALLIRLHQREYGMNHIHQSAIYAVNMALFVMTYHQPFDILDPDFLTLTSAFATIASRSRSGRNMFHLFRQIVRSKGQGARIRESGGITGELKALFDERVAWPSRFDKFAEGLEKLQEERYRVLEWGHPLFEMLERFEILSLGRFTNLPGG